MQTRANYVVRVKLLHTVSYTDIETVTNSFINRLENLGGELVESPKLKIEPFKLSASMKKRIYQKALKDFTKANPQIKLSPNTPPNLLKEEGLGQLLQVFNHIEPFHYYMQITYTISRNLYINSKPYLLGRQKRTL